MDSFVQLVVLALFAVGICAITGVITMLAWNHVAPDVFGLVEITWGQGFCLNLLGQFFFKGSATVSKS